MAAKKKPCSTCGRAKKSDPVKLAAPKSGKKKNTAALAAAALAKLYKRQAKKSR